MMSPVNNGDNYGWVEGDDLLNKINDDCNTYLSMKVYVNIC